MLFRPLFFFWASHCIAIPLQTLERWIPDSAWMSENSDSLNIAKQKLQQWTEGPRLGIEGALGYAGVDEDIGPQGAYTSWGAKVIIPWIRPHWSTELALERLRIESDRDRNALPRKRANVVRDVRLSYLDWWSSLHRLELARVFLQGTDRADSLLMLREAQSRVLERDRLEFLSAYALAVRDSARASAVMVGSIALLESIFGRSLRDSIPEELELPLPPKDWKASWTDSVEKIHTSRDRWWSNISMDVGIGGRADFYADRTITNDARLFATADIPLGVSSKEAFKRVIQEEQALVRKRVQNEWRGLSVDWERQRATRSAAQDALLFAQGRVRQAEEACRVASLRKQRIDDEPLERSLQASVQYWNALIDASDAEYVLLRSLVIQLWIADLSMSQPMDTILVQYQGLHGKAHWLSPLQHLVLDAKDSSKTELGFYAWKTKHWLMENSFTTPVMTEVHPTRILVSFSSGELDSIFSNSDYAMQIHRKIRDMNRQGIHVSVIFGDPSYLLPEGRPKLEDILFRMEEFPFAGIYLDLEPEQLTPAQLPISRRSKALVQTIQAARRSTVKPIGLITHHRWITSSAKELKESGVSEMVAMVYSSDENTLRAKANEIAKVLSGSSWRLAVSVEAPPILQPNETLRNLGRRNALSLIRRLEQEWSPLPGFQGIDVQDLEAWGTTPP